MSIYQCTKWGRTVLGTLLFQTVTLILMAGSEIQLQAMPYAWINELHYDNSGGDVNEFIEIAGPTGTDLQGYTLILYNGSSGEPYITIGLAGILPDQGNGFGTLAFDASGIQNGGPDGIALADDASTLIQFLSYEGAFTGVGGAADGVLSIDILVSETTSTPLGQSLQLIGRGTSYDDFIWSGPIEATFGAINSGQELERTQSPTHTVPDGGSSLALFSIALLGLMCRPRRRQGVAAQPRNSILR